MTTADLQQNPMWHYAMNIYSVGFHAMYGFIHAGNGEVHSDMGGPGIEGMRGIAGVLPRYAAIEKLNEMIADAMNLYYNNHASAVDVSKRAEGQNFHWDSDREPKVVSPLERDELFVEALSALKSPFTYRGGLVFADNFPHAIARVRGWGRISYAKNVDPGALQDMCGEILATALTEYWQHHDRHVDRKPFTTTHLRHTEN